MAESSATVRYTGPARGVSALAQMLNEEGLDVDYLPPMETRSIDPATVGALVVVTITVTATQTLTKAVMDAAIKRGVSRFRASRFGSGQVQLEEPDEQDG